MVVFVRSSGPSELDLSLLGETSLADVACKYDEVRSVSNS